MSRPKTNTGIVDLDEAIRSILDNGGGITEKQCNGYTHVSVYSRDANRHLSYNIDDEGNVSEVHTDRNGKGYMTYKGGR